MDWREYLFSFEGRAPRWEYWLFFGIGICYAYPVIFMLLPLVQSGAVSPATRSIINMAIGLPLFWPALAIAVRRLHDRGKSKDWAWFFIGLPAGVNILIVLLVAIGSSSLIRILQAPLWILVLLSSIATLWGFVELGFLRGTVGDNAFGPDPLPPVAIRDDGRKVYVETPGGHRVSLAVTGADGVVRKEYYYVAESDPERARVLVRNTEGARDADVAVVGTILHQTIETLNLKPGTFIPAPRAKA